MGRNSTEGGTFDFNCGRPTMSQLAWLDSKLLSYEEAGLDSAGWPNGAGTVETIKT
jgi:hypothetical protein